MSAEASFVLVFAAILLLTTAEPSNSPLKLSPASVVVKYGDPVTINCSTLTNQSNFISWEAPQGGTGLKKVSHLTWSVERLTEWTISPICQMFEEETSNQYTVTPTVVLYAFPDSIHISSSAGSDGTMTEGTAYNFTCTVPNVAPVGNLTVRLHRGDAVIHTHTFNHSGKKPVNQLSVTRFVPSGNDNGITFRCEAILDLQPEGPKLRVFSEPYNITVKFGPVVICKNSTLEGDTLENLCDVTGNPTPDVTWLKDGERVHSNLRLSRGYTGEYVIKAEGASLVTKRLRPAIYYDPELFCPSVYTVLEHTPHNLTCTVEGYPKPNIIWYKDGEEVELPENLTRRDAGQYLIVAESVMATVNATVDITVVYPPSQIAELEDTEVDVGSPVWLKCSSMGNPRPQYVWNYYRSENVVEENDDGVSRLLIHNATMLNMGSYTCRGWNDRGSALKTVKVHVKGARQECPIKISPEKMVIEYQSKVQNVTCEPTTSGSRNIVKKVSWQLQPGNNTDSAILSVDPCKDWDLQPVCMATFTGIGKCHKALQFTLYKTPDSVAVRHVDNQSAVREKRQFQLRCDITSVAPAQHLTVRWYQGNKTVQPTARGWQESLHVTGCPSENVTGCDVRVTRTPVNVSSTITIALDRSDGGTPFRCEAELDLGPDGPQPPPKMVSSPLNITIYYKPSINTTKLPKVIPVFQGYPEELVCEAEGQPLPKIQWFYSADKVPRVSGDKLLVTEAGYYNCSATNEVDSVFHVVEVISKEDYLPLIAGLVAITVIVISIVFVFIYSIYYKNTKMRHYSLKNPKLNTQNGNVAHNSWESQFSITKLS